ncbi:MAG: Ig-like domain-containing protein [Gemmatimonadota bacterium]|nr:Ig-like domain-containing protein [Gemmatimonadota bacterium]
MKSSMRCLALLLLGPIAAACGASSDSGTTGPGQGPGAGGNPAAVASIRISPTSDSTVVRRPVTFTATAQNAVGSVVSGTVTWTSSDTDVARVSPLGVVTPTDTGQATISASQGGQSASATIAVSPAPLTVRGLFTQFEERGAPSGYYDGDLLQRWDSLDSYVGTTVATEVAAQMDAMRAIGVNTITFELRATDSVYTGNFTPPDCNVPPVLGVRWPRPDASKLANLVKLFDLAQQKGMRIILSLVNTHMDQPADTNALWLGPIFTAVGRHPALAFVQFAGDVYVDPGSNSCGTPAEPPLWLGPTAAPAAYVKWAIGFGQTMGLSPQQLSAEAIVGDAFVQSQPPAGAGATGGHLWDPLGVLKTIFDQLGIPDSLRTYALSFYEHRKCQSPAPTGCVDVPAGPWADSTVRRIFATVGPATRAHIVAIEMGVTPGDPSTTAQQGLDDLLSRMERYGLDGGSYYRWTGFQNSDDGNPSVAVPVKLRGYAYTYTAIKDVLAKHYGGR